MINLLLNELKLVAKIRRIKDYENKFENKLIKALSKPETKIKYSEQRIKEIREKFSELRDFFKSKTKEIRKDLYNTENKTKFSTPEIKEIGKNNFELEKNLSKLKKYYDYDDIEYKRIRDAGNLFDLSINEDYYKPVIANSAFNNN